MGRKSHRPRSVAAPINPFQQKNTAVPRIVFGSNPTEKRVLLRFEVPVGANDVTYHDLTFSPEDAEDIAHKLLERAKMARGELPHPAADIKPVKRRA